MPKWIVRIEEIDQDPPAAAVVVEAANPDAAKRLALEAATRGALEYDAGGHGDEPPVPTVESCRLALDSATVTLHVPQDHPHDPQACPECETVFCGGCLYDEVQAGTCPGCGAGPSEE